MRTEDLIIQLAGDTRPVPGRAVERQVARNVAIGGVISLGLMLIILGPRPNLATAATTFSFWLKAGFTAALALAGLFLTCRLARPGRPIGWGPLALLAIALAVVAILGLREVITAAPDNRVELWLGQSWRRCLVWTLLLSGPLLAGGLLAMRRFAPTAPVWAGLAVGLAAGGLGATIYSLSCPEPAAAFLATWYVLGMALVGAMGAALGARVLRW